MPIVWLGPTYIPQGSVFFVNTEFEPKTDPMPIVTPGIIEQLVPVDEYSFSYSFINNFSVFTRNKWI